MRTVERLFSEFGVEFPKVNPIDVVHDEKIFSGVIHAINSKNRTPIRVFFVYNLNDEKYHFIDISN